MHIPVPLPTYCKFHDNFDNFSVIYVTKLRTDTDDRKQCQAKVATTYTISGVFRGPRWCDYPPSNFGLTVNFWIIFIPVAFVIFVLRLNRKIRVPKLIVTVFSACIKMHPNLSLEGLFFREGPTPPPHPITSMSTAHRPVLTEILNTPLYTIMPTVRGVAGRGGNPGVRIPSRDRGDP